MQTLLAIVNESQEVPPWLSFTMASKVCTQPTRKVTGGGGFFHSKGTWGCAAREGILFRPSSLAKGVLFGNFNRVKSRQGYAFWEFWSKRC